MDLNLEELARLRQGCYRFCGTLFLYPEERRLAKLIAAAGELYEGDSLASFPFFGPWQQLFRALHRLAEDEIAELQEQYTRLFLVNPDSPPYESFYLDPQRNATGWVVAQLEREYAKRGLALSSSLQEPADHAAVELEFMAFLCKVEAQAWNREASEEGRQILNWERAFLEGHLKRWFPAFARRLATLDPEGLYTLSAEAAAAFIQHDRDLVALLLERVWAVGGIS